MVRSPAVAGRFYPNNPEVLSETVGEFLGSADSRRRAIGVVVPHAGYIYSGAVAGAVYARTEMPRRSIILCPNHTGLGRPLAIMSQGSWRTPLGDLQIDSALCQTLMRLDEDLEEDAAAHQFEHALEVQLPFLQYMLGTEHRFVPITVGIGDFEGLSALGHAIAEAIQQSSERILIIASSDLNHYESDSITRVKDAKALDQILKLDPRGLWQTVRQERISMCGFGPVTSMLVAGQLLQANRAELIRYSTSAETSQDFDRVVGYAGVILEKV